MSGRPSPLWAVVAAMVVGGAGGLWLGRGGIPARHNVSEPELVLGSVIKRHGDALLQQGNYLAARELFVRSSPGMPDVVSLRKGLLQAERELRNHEILAEAEQALADHDVQEAASKLLDFEPGSRQTDHRDRLERALDDICETKIAALEATWKAEDVAPVEEACYQRPGLVERAMEVVNVRESASGRARLRFREGDEAGALAFAHGCRPTEPGCEGLVSDLQRFFSRYRRIDSMAADDALDLLPVADQISPGSMYRGALKARAALQLVKQATDIQSVGDLPAAVEAARRALALDPYDRAAQGVVDGARDYAKTVFMRAYAVQSSDPEEAKRLFKTVLQLTPADDEYHVKAQARVGP
jgi:tetratricopeptide (TPR) repeat protein